MSTLKVDAIRHNSATSDAITTAADGTCTAKLTSVGGGGLSHRNIFINGAMMVAQRGVTSTSQDYQTVDRMKSVCSNNDEVATQSQSDVASGTTPYTSGFRKAFKLQNGNQTSGANADDVVRMQSRLEAQDLANSGWNYKSSSSYITLSFWCKSSVAQNFYIQLVSYDGSVQSYTFETGSLTADTWTKVTHSIPGNSNLQFDNDANLGLDIYWIQYYGTDNTSSGHSLNSWAAYASGSKSPDMATTWYTTNDATWELTGVQLEVGDTATSFEHLSFSEELRRCQRYYYQVGGQRNDGGPDEPYGVILPHAMNASSIRVKGVLQHPVHMRAAPTVSGGGSGTAKMQSGDNTSSSVLVYQSTWTNSNSTKFTWIDFSPNSGSISQVGYSGVLYANNDTYHLKVSAEL